MTGCALLRACRLACWFGEESQHSVTPQLWQVRRWTQVSPVFTQASQTCTRGGMTVVRLVMSGHAATIMVSLLGYGRTGTASPLRFSLLGIDLDHPNTVGQDDGHSRLRMDGRLDFTGHFHRFAS